MGQHSKGVGGIGGGKKLRKLFEGRYIYAYDVSHVTSYSQMAINTPPRQGDVILVMRTILG